MLENWPKNFMDKVKFGDVCWEWTATKTDGYGMFRYDGRMRLAHRISYSLSVGRIPEGMQIDHLCRNRACVNPLHMEVVTQAENTRRGLAGENMRKKTHCPAGHPYDDSNTYIYNGYRHCKACRKKATREWHRANPIKKRKEALAKRQSEAA